MSNTVFYVPELQKNKAFVDWRGNYPGGYGWRHATSLSNITRVANHHSVTSGTKSAKADVDRLWQIHRNNGWGGIGYNFVVTTEEKNGYAVVAYVGDLGNARAHTPNAKGAQGISAGFGNNHIIGICAIGSFHTGKLPSLAQRRSIKLLNEELIFKEPQRLPKIPSTWNTFLEHLDFDWTQCATGGSASNKKKFKDAIVNVAMPKPPAPPKPKKPEWESSFTTKGYPKKLTLYSDTYNINFDSGDKTVLKKGVVVDISGEMKRNGDLYYRTVWSTNNNIWAGIPAKAFIKPEPIDVDFEPKPKPSEVSHDADAVDKDNNLGEDGVTDYFIDENSETDIVDAQGETSKVKNKLDTKEAIIELAIDFVRFLWYKVISLIRR